MEAITIPPTQELVRFAHGGMHLLLTEQISSDKKYHDHYRDRRIEGDYLIVDNSAHENGSGSEMEIVMKCALALHAQEIVLPDVLGDGLKTLDHGERALKWLLENPFPDYYHEQFKMMLVPQGRDYQEWQLCLRTLLDMYMTYSEQMRPHFSTLPVIGLSKDYEDWHARGLIELLRMDLEPLRLPVHLLGWGKRHWKDLSIIAREYDFVRSVDSAKPFVYALMGIRFEFEGDLPYIPRQENYFLKKLSEEERQVAGHNIGIMRLLANGWHAW